MSRSRYYPGRRRLERREYMYMRSWLRPDPLYRVAFDGEDEYRDHGGDYASERARIYMLWQSQTIVHRRGKRSLGAQLVLKAQRSSLLHAKRYHHLLRQGWTPTQAQAMLAVMSMRRASVWTFKNLPPPEE